MNQAASRACSSGLVHPDHGAGLHQGRRLPWLKWVILVVFIAVPSLLIPYFRSSGGDLDVLLKGGQRLVHAEPLYQVSNRFTYPPFAALPFAVLAALPESIQREVWYAVNFTCMALILSILARQIRPVLQGHSAQTGARVNRLSMCTFWSLFFLLAARHVLAPIENQQYDLLVLLLVVLAIDFSCSERHWRAGAFAGLAAACKATPLLFLPTMLWQRRWLASITFLIAAASATFLPDVLFPSGTDELWVQQWFTTYVAKVSIGESPNVEGAWTDWNMLNQSLAGTWHRLSTPSPKNSGSFDVRLWAPSPRLSKFGLVAAQVGIVAWLWLTTRRSLANRANTLALPYRRLGEGSAVVSAMLLLSPMSSKAHFCVLLLPIAFCLADFLHRRRDWFVGCMLVLLFVLGAATAKGIVGRELGSAFLARGSVTWCALASLLGTGWILLRADQPIIDTWRKSAAPGTLQRLAANHAAAQTPSPAAPPRRQHSRANYPQSADAVHPARTGSSREESTSWPKLRIPPRSD